jgi:cell division protein FtsL
VSAPRARQWLAGRALSAAGPGAPGAKRGELAAYSYPAPRSSRARRRTLPPRRVRWDRVGRVTMLCVLCALLYLYISAGVSLLSTWREAGGTNATVASMQREYHRLRVQQASLESPARLEMQARELGMMFPGERQYLVRGLPDN